jgi:hypothetical protein
MQNSSNPGTLRVIRRNRFADALRSYRIYVDGKEAGKVPNGGMLELRCPAGEVTVQASIDWCESTPISVRIAPNAVTEIEVTSGWRLLFALIAITFGRKTYLRLTPLTPKSV